MKKTVMMATGCLEMAVTIGVRLRQAGSDQEEVIVALIPVPKLQKHHQILVVKLQNVSILLMILMKLYTELIRTLMMVMAEVQFVKLNLDMNVLMMRQTELALVLQIKKVSISILK